MPQQIRAYPLLTFHRSGFTAYFSDGPNISGTLNGYDHPERFELGLQDRTEREAFIGAWVIDKRSTVEEKPGNVIRSPMVDVRLGEFEVSRFAEKVRHLPQAARCGVEMLLSHLPGSLNPGLAVLALADDAFQGLDYVSVPVYVAWWRAAGARIGRVWGNGIEWYPVVA